MSLAKSIATGIAATAMLVGTPALADYPEKPVKIMVGFSAGGGTDTTARGFASYMHEAPSMNHCAGRVRSRKTIFAFSNISQGFESLLRRSLKGSAF